jgi:large subunit ribosomal protein L9
MEVILLETIENLGDLGSLTTVKAGYARNFLFPQGKAQPATAENLKAFETRRAELEAAAATAIEKAEARLEQLSEMVLTIPANAGQEGKLFGSVTNIEVTEAINATGVMVERSEIRMPDGPIRMLGEYEVGVHLYTGIDAVVQVIVEAEE